MREYENWGDVEGQMDLLDYLAAQADEQIERERWQEEQRRRFDVA
jgi:hypothetical protein